MYFFNGSNNNQAAGAPPAPTAVPAFILHPMVNADTSSTASSNQPQPLLNHQVPPQAFFPMSPANAATLPGLVHFRMNQNGGAMPLVAQGNLSNISNRPALPSNPISSAANANTAEPPKISPPEETDSPGNGLQARSFRYAFNRAHLKKIISAKKINPDMNRMTIGRKQFYIRDTFDVSETSPFKLDVIEFHGTDVIRRPYIPTGQDVDESFVRQLMVDAIRRLGLDNNGNRRYSSRRELLEAIETDLDNRYCIPNIHRRLQDLFAQGEQQNGIQQVGAPGSAVQQVGVSGTNAMDVSTVENATGYIQRVGMPTGNAMGLSHSNSWIGSTGHVGWMQGMGMPAGNAMGSSHLHPHSWVALTSNAIHFQENMARQTDQTQYVNKSEIAQIVQAEVERQIQQMRANGN
jgi:hypothetical protein